MTTEHHYRDGPALAAIFAAALGVLTLGLATVLGEASPAIKASLTWWDPVGPLSGKTGMGVWVWGMSWVLLHLVWKNRNLPFSRLWRVSLIFIGLGYLGTFPPFFEWFANH